MLVTLGQKMVFCGLFPGVPGQNVEFSWISCGAMIFFSWRIFSSASLLLMSSLR